MRPTLAVVIALAFAHGNAIGGSLAHPDWRPDGKALLVEGSCRGDGDREIYLRHLVTGEEERLTTRAGRDGYPRFSPEGTRIAFHRRHEDGTTSIVVMTLATRSEKEYSCDGRLQGSPRRDGQGGQG